jgi:hypothetical protein
MFREQKPLDTPFLISTLKALIAFGGLGYNTEVLLWTIQTICSTFDKGEDYGRLVPFSGCEPRDAFSRRQW